jgi:uncharacterized membrane protein
MAKPRKLLASAAVAAGLIVGGVAGVVVGVPGVSGAQTTTVPESPSTTPPDSGEADRDRAPGKENCPRKGDGDAPGPAEADGASTNIASRPGARRSARL